MADKLLLNVEDLIAALDDKAAELDDIIKRGRTQLEDAVPIRLWQEFAAYSSCKKRCKRLLERAVKEMYCVNPGGTAIVTAINASGAYVHNIVPALRQVTGIDVVKTQNLIDDTQNLDGFVFVSLTCMKNAVRTLIDNCIVGIRSNRARCEALLQESVGTVTALYPYIGYKKAAEPAKEALVRNVRIKDLVRGKKILDDKAPDKLLDPFAMTTPTKDGAEKNDFGRLL